MIYGMIELCKILPDIKKKERITSEFIILVGNLHGGKSAINIYDYIKDSYYI